MPLFIIFMGDLYDSFDPQTNKEKVYSKSLINILILMEYLISLKHKLTIFHFVFFIVLI